MDIRCQVDIDQIMTLVKVFISDPCLLGLPEILAPSHTGAPKTKAINCLPGTTSKKASQQTQMRPLQVFASLSCSMRREAQESRSARSNLAGPPLEPLCLCGSTFRVQGPFIRRAACVFEESIDSDLLCLRGKCFERRCALFC